MEITRDEFLNNIYEEVIKQRTSSKSKLKKIIKENKKLTIGLVAFTIFSIINIILIYTFFITVNTL